MKPFKILTVAAAVAFALGASPAGAQGDLPIGTAEKKNLVQRTVTIDDQVFKVTAKTEIYDLTGLPIQLERVSTVEELSEPVDAGRVTYAYDAAGSTLLVLRAMPLPR